MNLVNFYKSFHAKLNSNIPSPRDNFYNYYINVITQTVKQYIDSRKGNMESLYRELRESQPDNYPISCYHEIILWLYFNKHDEKNNDLYIKTCHTYFPLLQHTFEKDKFIYLMKDNLEKNVLQYTVPNDNIFSAFSNFTWAEFDAKYFHISELPPEIDKSKIGVLTININYKNTCKASNYSYKPYNSGNEGAIGLLDKELIEKYKGQYEIKEFEETRTKYNWSSQNQDKHIIKIWYFDNEFTLCINNIQDSPLKGTLFFSTDEVLNILSGKICTNMLSIEVYFYIIRKVQLYFFSKDGNEDSSKNIMGDSPKVIMGDSPKAVLKDKDKRLTKDEIRELAKLFNPSEKAKSIERIYVKVKSVSKCRAFIFYTLLRAFNEDKAELTYQNIYDMLNKAMKYKL